MVQTRIQESRPDAVIEATLTGGYELLREHIAAHRWYLGEKRQAEVSYDEAIISWYDNVYMPIVSTIREQDILKDFPGRTETDLYLWIIQRQWALREIYGEEVPIEQAMEKLSDEVTKSAE
jgi:hypothetical protein